MEKGEIYQYKSKKEYSEINREIVTNLRAEHEQKQNYTYYHVNLKYYNYYQMYYIVIPKQYLNQIKILRKRKEDIFAKGKILTFSSRNSKFHFDAVVDFTEDIYSYIVPIKEKYRYSKDLTGEYVVNERNGDLTFDRMDQAIDTFNEGECCSENLEKYILGQDISNDNINNKKFYNLFNYKRYFKTSIHNFANLKKNQASQIKNIFYNEMNTIQLKSNSDQKIICLIINAIYQMRKNITDKILICSSSNLAADSIALNLLDMNKFITKLNILRIYAKNQELIKRNKKLYQISYHKLLRKKLKKKNSMIEMKRKNG